MDDEQNNRRIYAIGVSERLKQIYEPDRKQVSMLFYASLIVTILGFLLNFVVAAIAVVTGHTSVGIFTLVTNTIPEIAPSLIFWQARRANKRIDNCLKKLSELENIYLAMEIASTMPPGSEQQNNVKEMITSRLLGALDVPDQNELKEKFISQLPQALGTFTKGNKSPIPVSAPRLDKEPKNTSSKKF